MNNTEYLEFAKTQFTSNRLECYTTEPLLLDLKKLSDILLEINSHINLTAIKDEKLVVTRHFVDCLKVADKIPANSKVIDIGSGGGMPSIPLAIARKDLKITALDATSKKVDYINETAEILGLNNLHAICGRAETLSHGSLRESFDVGIARAVAELRILLEISVPFVRKDGYFIAMKGKSGKEELAQAERAIQSLNLSTVATDFDKLTDYDGTISERSTFVFQKNKSNLPSYPRRYAQILKNPL